jgi:hypothetical protein
MSISVALIVPLAGMLLLASWMSPGRAASQQQPRPSVYSVAPEHQCEVVKVVAGKQIRRELTPPSPGLRATAVTSRNVRVFWSFERIPTRCKPRTVRLAILASRDPRATAKTSVVQVGDRRAGSALIKYCQCLQPPDQALAATYGANGSSSRTVRILIRH